MRYKLEIEVDNAAFDDGNTGMMFELSRILHNHADEITDSAFDGVPRTLYDINGNRVGRASMTED